MKIKTKKLDYDKVMALPRPKHKNPWRPNFLLQTVIRLASLPTLWKTGFTYEKHRMDLIDPKQPVLILMNHSSFTDMKLASAIFYPKKYGIVTTVDAFVGMDLLMRQGNIAAAVPMHFWNQASVPPRILRDPCTAPYRNKLHLLCNIGEQIAILL